MAKNTLNEIIQGLIDVDRGVIDKITNSVEDLKDKITNSVEDLEDKVSRGSGSYALVDINTPGRGGNGTVVSDTSASHGQAIRITTSSSANYAPFIGTFSDVKFGHYAICARVKTNNLTSSNLVQLKVLNGNTEILAANFTGTNFGSSSKYAYLYSTFTYESISNAKQPLSFQLHTHKVNGVQITFDYAYISMIIPSVFL